MPQTTSKHAGAQTFASVATLAKLNNTGMMRV
jgi:hypothetical protein